MTFSALRLVRASLSLAIVAVPAFSAQAALVAEDQANNPGYPSNWNSIVGVNAGTGFQAWGSAGPGGRVVSNPAESHVQTGGETWQMWVDNGANGSMYRPFTADTGTGVGALDSTQTFTASLNLRYVNGQNGIALDDASGNQRFAFYFQGGGDAWHYTDGSGDHAISNMHFTQNPVSFSFTLTGTNSYSFSASDVDWTGPESFSNSGSLGGVAGAGVSQAEFFIHGSGDNNDLYFNSLAISAPTVSAVPEPATLSVLMCVGSLALLRRR